MTWKRSKDGGLDYDPKVHEEHQQTFNPYGSAHTMTFGVNQEEVMFDNPKNAHERIHNFRIKHRKKTEEKLRRGLA